MAKKRRMGGASHLTIDLRDIDGHSIAQKGAIVNQRLIREVIKKGRRYQGKYSSLNHPVILKTLKQVMNEETYAHVFVAPGIQKKILSICRKSKIQTGIRREILRLKKNSFFTYRHFVLMAALSTKMAMDVRSLGYNAKDAFVLALTHDIGKVRLPTSILNKKTPLTSNEYRILHSYPNFSVLLLRYYMGKRSEEAVRVAYEHHEKMDGSGYPKGIKRISKYTKIVAVIDIFDALVSKRPYRKRGFTARGAFDKLLHEMHEGKLPQFPIRLLISYWRKGNPNFRTMKVSIRAREEDPDGNSYGKLAK